MCDLGTWKEKPANYPGVVAEQQNNMSWYFREEKAFPKGGFQPQTPALCGLAYEHVWHTHQELPKICGMQEVWENSYEVTLSDIMLELIIFSVYHIEGIWKYGKLKGV